MKQKIKLSRIVDEVGGRWSSNLKLLFLFLSAYVISLEIVWRMVLMNPNLTENDFWMFFSIISWSYVSVAIILVFRFQQVRFETALVKKKEENLSMRQLSEAYIQLAGAKPDTVPEIIETIQHVKDWNNSNKQLEYLKLLDDKLQQISLENQQLKKLIKKKDTIEKKEEEE